jgi:cbb3-type cytochrome oxidase maturation protein
MDVLIFLIPVALLLGGLGLMAFLWSLKAGQYEDLEGAKWRILSDDDLVDEERREEKTGTGDDRNEATG